MKANLCLVKSSFYFSRSLALLLLLGFVGGCGPQETGSTAPSTSPTPAERSAADRLPAATDNTYQLGTVINFGAGGGSERFRVDGWSPSESQFTWSVGNSAKLMFSLGKVDQPLTLRMTMASLINPPALVSQPVEVIANGQKIADWEVAVTADFKATIPAGAIKDDGLLRIELKTPKATSPKSLGLSEDLRVLGVLVSQIEITKS